MYNAIFAYTRTKPNPNFRSFITYTLRYENREKQFGYEPAIPLYLLKGI